jgi:hypothetical protein
MLWCQMAHSVPSRLPRPSPHHRAFLTRFSEPTVFFCVREQCEIFLTISIKIYLTLIVEYLIIFEYILHDL